LCFGMTRTRPEAEDFFDGGVHFSGDAGMVSVVSLVSLVSDCECVVYLEVFDDLG
jgi:hypothetical protein